jgi:hypothetical protein
VKHKGNRRAKAKRPLNAEFSCGSCDVPVTFQRQLPTSGQQNVGGECVLLIGGKVVRGFSGWRTMIRQNLGNVQPGKMWSDTVCCGKSEAAGETVRKPC